MAGIYQKDQHLTLKEKILQAKEQKWQEEKKLKMRKAQLSAEKREFSSRKLSTSKKLILFLFINCTLIELFTGYVTIKSLNLAAYSMIAPDFTPLTALIGAVIGEVIGFAVYSLKAAKENVKGGIAYDAAMADLFNNSIPKDPEAAG